MGVADNGNGLLIGAGQCHGLKPHTYIHIYISFLITFWKLPSQFNCSLK